MKKGVIAGNFDILHPGYIKMFKEAASNCDCLIILLHTDPSIERSHKLKPILSVEDRKEMLYELKSICDIFTYTYEEQLLDLLKMGEFNVRFLGDDYRGKPFTGDNLNIPIHYLNRDHGWSTTKFKKQIAETVGK
jgi:glycerol-3-phosphate cytidylyltransferase